MQKSFKLIFKQDFVGMKLQFEENSYIVKHFFLMKLESLIIIRIIIIFSF